ncbi:MAG: histone deacetylase [Methylophagaceae bacterium]
MKRREFFALFGVAILPEVVKAKSCIHTTGLVLDERFLEHHISSHHPEKPQRYQIILEKLFSDGLLNKLQIIKPKQNIEQWLYLIHSKSHIKSIKNNDSLAHDHSLIATGAILAAVDAVCINKVRNAFSASRPPGHHAKNTGQEEGFCYYNHIAIAARYAQKQYGLEKVLIVDWDYHHGNGTEWAFYSDPTVLYFSTHDVFAYPGTGFPSRTGEGAGQGFNINVSLECGATDQDIINAFQQKLLPIADKFSPDLILISAGFDSRQDDLLGCLNITDQGFIALTKIVTAIANKHCNGKIVSMLEGGYNLQGNASAVSAHITTLMDNG